MGANGCDGDLLKFQVKQQERHQTTRNEQTETLQRLFQRQRRCFTYSNVHFQRQIIRKVHFQVPYNSIFLFTFVSRQTEQTGFYGVTRLKSDPFFFFLVQMQTCVNYEWK